MWVRAPYGLFQRRRAGHVLHQLGGGRRRSSGGRASSTRTSLAALERQARAAQREQEITAVQRTEQRLTSLHREHFEPAAALVLPEPAAPGEHEVARQLSKEAYRQTPWWRFGLRPAARREAAARAPQVAAAEHNAALAQSHAWPA